MSPKLVYVTVESKDKALSMARLLLEEHLIACANVIDGAMSLYRWEGRICEEREAILILKTSENRLSDLTNRILALHDYDCPCVAAFDIAGGNNDFLRWIDDETLEDDR